MPRLTDSMFVPASRLVRLVTGFQRQSPSSSCANAELRENKDSAKKLQGLQPIRIRSESMAWSRHTRASGRCGAQRLAPCRTHCARRARKPRWFGRTLRSEANLCGSAQVFSLPKPGIPAFSPVCFLSGSKMLRIFKMRIRIWRQEARPEPASVHTHRAKLRPHSVLHNICIYIYN